MKWLFYAGLAGITVIEILKVYLIMPLPGSQRMESLALAYFLHTYRWVFRIAFLMAILLGSRGAFRTTHPWLPVLGLLLAIPILWFVNFRMSAESMFEPPHELTFKSRGENVVDEASMVLGVEHQGEAKAYPIRFLVYHHQVQDTVGGKPVLVTYCSVCRSGRVFEPMIQGKPETFRLVGMDHFNAMFEDATTKSWWRQVNGVAAAGPLQGEKLPEVESRQMTLVKWFELHPSAMVMQVDEVSKPNYDTLGKFERGESKGELTRTDPASWNEKSWVVGISIDGQSKAYDWNRLKELRILNDVIGTQPVVLALSSDQASFAAFERPNGGQEFTIASDVISANGRSYDFDGRDLAAPAERLKPVPAHQEFWHSWQTFHPDTLRHQ